MSRQPTQAHSFTLTGGVGAARDVEKLEELGVTHVVNASPVVPCFHRKRLRYRSIVVYDDEQDDIAQHFATTSAFIAKVLQSITARRQTALGGAFARPAHDNARNRASMECS